ncbi:class I SAM-dependent methyltransferase [Bosea sp. LjRoot90]|uniref:class I SAM-dependent methyltransferase n=1 Tax=Bosea sp. LjRoot90 TaxID=3342342 RepID=UPI003ECCEAA1
MEASDVAACWEANAETWTRHARAGYDLYRDAQNTPAFLANLPDVTGLAGLDIGCGEGSNTRKLAEAGAHITAIDIAPTFIRHAQEAEAVNPLGIAYRLADGMALPFAEASRVLKPGGFLQFSILHPCFATPGRKVMRDEAGTVLGIEVREYFRVTNGEIESWRFGAAPTEEKAKVEPFRVPRFHRTLSDWVNLLVATGFRIEHMHEPGVDAETAKAVPYLADTYVAPLFLHMRVRKAATA